MKKYLSHAESILAMSNVRGKYITVANNIRFSFFYSPRWTQHGPRVKVVFNPEVMRRENASVQKLCDDWRFIYNEKDKHPSQSEIAEMQQFFRHYLILFLLVWDNHLSEADPSDYFVGRMPLSELISNIYFYNDFEEEMSQLSSIEELEEFCRANHLVNMYGN